MRIEILEEAEEELFEAALWYETREGGLGVRFRDEVSHVLEKILEDPFLWREQPGGYRRVNCPVFPYFIPYFIRGDVIVIAAIAHAHRKPGNWKARLE
jgi:hypothetical protein